MALLGAPQLPEPSLPGALLDVTRSPSLSRSLAPSASISSRGLSRQPSRLAMAATTPDMLALISAAQAKDTAKAEALLASGIPPNVKGPDSRTPLMHSCRLQDAATAQVLLSYGADPNLRNSFGYSPLGTVATLGALPLISLLMDNKPPADLESRTAEGMTPLLLAAQGGHVEAVKLLVKYGADIEARGRDGRGAIHWFARQSLHEGVEWLIKDGKADTELRNRDGYTAINTAAALGDLEMVKLLQSLGANMETRNNSGHTPVLSALLLLPGRSTNLATITYLIEEAKCNVNAEGEDGRTALHHAARMGELQVVKMLVEAGAVVDKKNVGGFTSLNAAAFYGNEEVVAYLLDRGADPNVASLEGWTSLHSASHRGHAAVARLLLANDADCEAQTDEGWTPLIIAANQSRPEIVQELLRAGVRTDVKSNDGVTAAEFAVMANSDAVKELLGAPDDYRVEGISAITGEYRATRDEYKAFKTEIEKQKSEAELKAAADELAAAKVDEMAMMEKSDEAAPIPLEEDPTSVDADELGGGDVITVVLEDDMEAMEKADDEDGALVNNIAVPEMGDSATDLSPQAEPEIDTDIPEGADVAALLITERHKSAALLKENNHLRAMLAASDTALRKAVDEANAALQSQAELANRKLRESAHRAEVDLGKRLEEAKAKFEQQLKDATAMEGKVGGSTEGMVESPMMSRDELNEAS